MSTLLRPAPLPGREDRWALFFDVDGTLVDIEARPEHVHVPPDALRLLVRASALLDGALALLSGRALDDLDRLTRPHAFPLAALHGCEWRDADGVRGSRAASPELAARIAAASTAGIRDMPGVWIEDKGIAFALHYRAAPQFGEAVLTLAQRIAASSGGGYVVQPGDCVAELKPAGANKGVALCTLMDAAPFAGRTPVVLGDDHTDEAAFAAARAQGGIAVIVGARRPTAATHALESPAAVRAWLAGVVARLERNVQR